MATKTIDTQQLPLRLPREDYEALRNLAYFTGRSMNSIVAELLRSYLAAAGRDAQLDAMLDRAETHYRDVLDKLAET